jgi:CRP/FNR family cyclic AMP-dependent transcriptional regulator
VEPEAVLRRVWLFAQLGDAEREQIRALARPRRCQAREVVVRQGDERGDLYAVVSGRLKVTTANVDGDEMVLSILGPGDVFGEIALLDRQPRSATVSALEGCELLVVERRPFHDLLLRVPALALSLMQVMAKRLRELTEHAQDVSLLGVSARLARALLALGRRFGERKAGKLEVALKLSQQELGEMVGATREMVNRCLRRWTDAGLIQLAGGKLVICDEAALAGVDEDG